MISTQVFEFLVPYFDHSKEANVLMETSKDKSWKSRSSEKQTTTNWKKIRSGGEEIESHYFAATAIVSQWGTRLAALTNRTATQFARERYRV